MFQSQHPAIYWLMVLAVFYLIASFMTGRWGGG